MKLFNSRHTPGNNRGLVLLIVLVFISGTVYMAIEYSHTMMLHRKIRDYHIDDLKASLYAESGIKLADVLIASGTIRNKLQDRPSFVLTREAGDGEIYIRVTREEYKTNINTLNTEQIREKLTELDFSDLKRDAVAKAIVEFREDERKLININELIYIEKLDYHTIYGRYMEKGLVDIFTAYDKMDFRLENIYTVQSTGSINHVAKDISTYVENRNGRIVRMFKRSN